MSVTVDCKITGNDSSQIYETSNRIERLNWLISRAERNAAVGLLSAFLGTMLDGDSYDTLCDSLEMLDAWKLSQNFGKPNPVIPHC